LQSKTQSKDLTIVIARYGTIPARDRPGADLFPNRRILFACGPVTLVRSFDFAQDDRLGRSQPLGVAPFSLGRQDGRFQRQLKEPPHPKQTNLETADRMMLYLATEP